MQKVRWIGDGEVLPNPQHFLTKSKHPCGMLLVKEMISGGRL
jgi:hypothetical protein